MYERIVEIITLVIAELRTNKSIADVSITNLESLGYSNSEISTALSWLIDRLEFSDNSFVNHKPDSSSFRILHEIEKDLFTSEAWGQVIQLHALGLLTNEHIEILIERTAMMGFRQVDIHQLRLFVAYAVFNISINNQPTNKLMLQGNETIN
jgi:uncharacterized protein Smg (DUF494 family)